MNLKAPNTNLWWLAVILGLIGLVVHLVSIPFLTASSFWIMAFGLLVLILATFGLISDKPAEKRKRTGKFEIKKSSDNQFYFNLKAANGEVILTSERYTAKASAENGIESVKTNAPDDGRYERKISSSSEPYFVLEAVNGETIGVSEMYSSESARDNGIQSVKNNAPGADVVDLS